jgi:predicted metal-dependent hydrolase
VFRNSIFFEHFYGSGERRYHPDSNIHDLSVRSGLGDLFLWHGAEEMGHRNVAFEVSRYFGAGYIDRIMGGTLFLIVAVVFLIPAIIGLRWQDRD